MIFETSIGGALAPRCCLRPPNIGGWRDIC